MSDFWKMVWLGVTIIAAFTILWIVGSFLGMVGSVATAPARVVSRTLQTDNILQNYELFFDLNGQFNARTAQIESQKHVLAEETDPDEKRRLRMELGAMQQSCRDIANQYNMNSQKQNRDLFKARNLPETLTCVD